MGRYKILKNSSLDVQLASDYQDNGWTFQDGKAIHDRLNQGSVRNKVFRPEARKEYVIKITVENLTVGYLDVFLGGVLFGRITNNGRFELKARTLDRSDFTMTAGLNYVTVSSLTITEGIIDGQTIVYDANARQFNGMISLFGDRMEKFLDDLVVFKNGRPWIGDKNDYRNTFFGESYPSIIKYYCNIDYDRDKDFYSIVINGNSAWSIDLIIGASAGKSAGQRSRIKSGNFVLDKGKISAPVLRDMNDVRFNDELQALLKGAYMQGKVMEVTLTSNSTDFVELISVEVDLAVK